ncbi:transglutaminase-like domain-containing protein [Patescibacteria group bacterium]|nr:transglutaminase-like domain-containing protein [Patescibacteria group bacterium]
MKNKILFLPKNNLLPRFLSSEKFLEQTNDIKKLSLRITKNKKSLYDKMETIFHFVTNNFKYCYPVKNRGVKNLKLDKLIGDCGEYSSLLITMLRCLGLPSRNQTGFVIDPKSKKIVEHGWASAYIKPYGWMDLDAQYASIDKENWRNYFFQRSGYRINFVNGFNIPIKPRLSPKFMSDNQKKIDTPFSYNSIQTLQPIFFVFKERIKFKENFTFSSALLF